VMSRSSTYLTLALGAFVAAPAPATAVTASADATPSTITYFGPRDPRTTRAVVHRLRLEAGPQDEHLSVSTFERGLSIEGPGVIGERGLGSGHGDDFGFPGRDGCPGRADPFVAETVEVTLPANTQSTISATEKLDLQRAPTSDSGFEFSWTVAPYTGQGLAPYPIKVSSVREPPFALAGIAGSELLLRAGRRGSADTIGDRQTLRVKPRSRLTLRGTITPARAGERITLWHLVPGIKRVKRLARVTVGPDGRFVYRRWRPVKVGRHELLATYAGVPGQVEATRSPCGGPQVLVRR